MTRTTERLLHRRHEFLRKHRDMHGQIRSDIWREGIKHIKRMKIAAGVLRRGLGFAPAPVSFVGAQWTQVGPTPLRVDKDQLFQGAGPVSGEVTDIVIDPRGGTDQTIYLATNDGGIWKSADGGTTWAPKTDGMPSLSMGAVALDPADPNTVYAGTGNLFDGAGLFAGAGFKGVGIYKSTDSGETWSIVGSAVFTNQGINRIALPAPNVLLVATNTGLFRSVDGGLNFGANAPLFNDQNPILGAGIPINDLKLDTASSSTIYAAVQGQGILQSTDGGVSFPNNLFTASNGAPAPGSFARITFTQSSSPDNKTMYASVEGSPATTYAGLFKSRDTGATWTVLPDATTRATENGNTSFFYAQTVGVDPQDANRVYIGFTELWVSTDGGTNFSSGSKTLTAVGGGTFTSTSTSFGKIHFDHHAIVFSPPAHRTGSPTRIYVGMDGGIATSADGGISWTNLNEGIATNLFRGIDIGRGSPANNQFTYGGTQDTGTVEHRPAFTGAEWHLGIDGDGGRVAVDPANPLRVYGADDGGFIVTNDGGTTWTFPAGTGLPLVFLFAVDPNNSSIVYVTEGLNSGFAPGPRLFKSTNTGTTFTQIQTFPANITAIATVGIDSNTLWVGLSNGTVQRTSDGGATWVPITVTGAPGGNAVEGIAIDPTDITVAVVVYSGVSGISPSNRTKHAFRTTDNGANWADISGTDGGDPNANLPDLPLHSVVIDPTSTPHTIIVATDSAVMQSLDNGASWQVLGVVLPNVDCVSLALDSAATPPLLRIGTYGRSSFELTHPAGQRLAVIANLAFGTVGIGSSATLTVRVFNVGSSNLTVSAFDRLAGSADFQLVSPPALPITINPGAEVDLTIQFQPSTAGNQSATFQITSDDPRQPTLQLPASGSSPASSSMVSGISRTGAAD